MDLAHINSKNWEEFGERYPAAASFLLGCSLQNEYLTVCNEIATLKRKRNPEKHGRFEWLLEREAQLGNLFKLVPNGDNSVKIERRPIHEFGQVDKYGNYIEQSELNEGHPGDPNEYGSST